jgi:hypothetical protein
MHQQEANLESCSVLKLDKLLLKQFGLQYDHLMDRLLLMPWLVL